MYKKTYICTQYIHIHIYIERERETEKERDQTKATSFGLARNIDSSRSFGCSVATIQIPYYLLYIPI